ncbi:hypothetical protein [Nocardiopsis xinjiangensis]|uniref:hypothetical protein n=1 Tax=Nocardiopsis xinjiangensis TaxID=124285 RepID=UPI00034ADBE2|nr:hypothetical protein [Nocardiopsis xinjiangensis]
MSYDYDARDWWTSALPNLRATAFCAVGHVHEDGHESTTGGSVTLPTPATRGDDMCTADDEDDSGTLARPHPAHLPTTDVDALVAVLTRVLSRRWDSREAVTALNTADVCFGRLDRLLRDGGELPARWAAAGTFVSVTGMVLADVDYDGVSEELRATGDAATCLRALRDAWSGWKALTGSLEAGGPLPGPWERP